ncbi:lytic transglycosylase [Alishewanella longhuensis]|uniref:Lytic transglycosylase n=1 Tax=Alishewanella longhuensis TaxID=1091037 RepID=A0ABQ3KVI3_9ALTE|nr:LysM peptidoglycan-binding domain-containing protein [Alishewanella longhuensis]GHG64075.1 lytic transglycosylase [Alishewanella longhuensis]
MTVRISAVVLLALLTGCVSTTGSDSDNTNTVTANSAPQNSGYKNKKASEDFHRNTASAESIADRLWSSGLSEEQLLDATELEDLWQRIQTQLSFNVPQTRAIVEQRNFYADNQNYLDRISGRAQPFLYYIVQELEKRAMPLELALLPIIESAFDPSAYSPARAAGMWQFMPTTGKRFGLKQNSWYDGRKDVIQSTQAALDYLQYLYNTLEHDWLNAIAAYNAGEGRIMRAIQANKKRRLPTDFWSLDLPAETTAYVPKLLALVDILARPEEFQIVWKFIANEPKIAVVEVGKQLDLSIAADLAEISLADLQALNPGFNQWATAPDGPHHLVLPIEQVDTFNSKLAQTPLEQLMQWQPYQVKSGDTLGAIAKRYQTTVSALTNLNKLSGNTIRIGQTLLIPRASGSDEQSAGPDLQNIGPAESSTQTEYIVQRGDTLWDLSRKYDVTVAQLRNWNKLASNAILNEGQVLQIIQSNQAQYAQLKTRTVNYRVRSGDSLAKIAQRFSVSVDDIIKWNNISPERYLQPGQQLTLLVAATAV